MYSFFEENKITDNISSFITSFTSNSNKYTFSNIAQLITHCIEEKKKGEAGDPDWVKKNPDWNKVVLIPVKVDFDTNNSIIGVSNNLDMESAELKSYIPSSNDTDYTLVRIGSHIYMCGPTCTNAQGHTYVRVSPCLHRHKNEGCAKSPKRFYF